MKHILASLSLLCALTLAGCGTLDKSAAYNGDKVLYATDQTEIIACNVIHEFVSFEFQHRAELASHPEIKAAADSIRSNAPTWSKDYDRARGLYLLVNTPENLASFNAALKVLQDGSSKATSFLFASQTLVKK